MDPKGWNVTKFKEWLSRPLTQEDDSFDLKEMIPSDDDGKYRLKKEFCGYANRTGGFFFFGVKDDKTIIGIDENDKEFTTKIGQIVITHIFPPTIDWRLYENISLEEQGKCIYVIKVFESVFWKKPHVVYSQNKGLCIPVRESGNLRLLTDGAEIRRVFLNPHGYYPEYNLHVIEILRQIKIKHVPDFNINERIILQAFKSYLRSTNTDKNIQITSGLESIETQVANINRTLLNGVVDGSIVNAETSNQLLEQMIDSFITNWGGKIL